MVSLFTGCTLQCVFEDSSAWKVFLRLVLLRSQQPFDVGQVLIVHPPDVCLRWKCRQLKIDWIVCLWYVCLHFCRNAHWGDVHASDDQSGYERYYNYRYYISMLTCITKVCALRWFIFVAGCPHERRLPKRFIIELVSLCLARLV